MSSKALVSKREVSPEVADNELVNVGAGVVAAGNTLTIGTADQTVNIPGNVSIATLSTTVDIKDRVIHLGVTTGNAAVPTLPIGISADRGASSGTKRNMSSLVWDEATSKWKLCFITQGDDATLGAYQALNCGIVTSDAGIVSTGGPVTLTGNAASGLTTSSGALTLTGAAASTWSTTAGALTLSGFAGISLQGNGTSALVVSADGTAITVQAGATLATTGTGNINLPNNGTSKFQIESVAVGANVTAANLDAVTGGTFAGMLQKRTVTIGVSGSGADVELTTVGLSQVVNLGAVLPANAMVLGVDLALTPFSGGGASAVSGDIGTSGDDDAIVSTANLFAAAVDGKCSDMPAGIAPYKLFTSGGAQLIGTITSDVNVSTLTAGQVIVTLSFVVLL